MMKNPVGEDDAKSQGRKIFQEWKLRLPQKISNQWMLDQGSIFFVSSEGALYVILPYDYTPTFWKHTGPWQQLEHKCFDDFDNDE